MRFFTVNIVINQEMVQNCVVRGCGSSWFPSSDIRFHAFPKDITRRNSWLSIIPLKIKFYESARICSLHFQETDYDFNMRLKRMAVPTKILKQESLSTDKVSSENHVPAKICLQDEHVAVVVAKCKPRVKKEAKGKCTEKEYADAMATGVNTIIVRVYKFFKREYEYLSKNYGTIFDITSISDYKDRTAEATGFEIAVVNRALQELGIQDGCPKKRKLVEKKNSNSETHRRVSVIPKIRSDCQPPNQSDHNYTPVVNEPIEGKAGVTRSGQKFVIYARQPKPNRQLVFKVDKKVNQEETQVISGISDDSIDPLKMNTDVENNKSQEPDADKNTELIIETDNIESAKITPHTSITIKEEIEIGEEELH